MARRHSNDDIQTWFDYGVELKTRCIYLGSASHDDEGNESGTDYTMAERCIKGLALLESANAEPLRIIMNNLGGDVNHAWAMFDAVKRSPCEVTVVGTGYVMSAGAVILQAADIRKLTPYARMMVHYGQSGAEGTPADVLPSVAEWKVHLQHFEELFLERIREKHPAYKISAVKRLLNKDSYFSAQEAVALGLADEILG